MADHDRKRERHLRIAFLQKQLEMRRRQKQEAQSNPKASSTGEHLSITGANLQTCHDSRLIGASQIIKQFYCILQ